MKKGQKLYSKAKKIILGSVDFRDPKKISKAKADRNFVIFFKHLKKYLRKRM